MKTATMIPGSTASRLMLIRFSYDPTVVAQVRCLRDRRFCNTGSDKYWTAPAYAENIEKLKSWGFTLDKSVEAELTASAKPDVTPVAAPTGMKITPFPYQQYGIGWLISRDGRGLLADEMGLGKTIQALGYLCEARREALPALIVVPNSVKLQWAGEIERRTDLKYMMTNGRSAASETDHYADIWLVNYDVLDAWVEKLGHVPFKTLVLDESHSIKNQKAKRTVAVQRLAARIPKVIAMSGTPVVNRPVEFFSTLNLIDKTGFPSFWKYAMDFCGAKHNGFGWDFKGSSNAEELNARLKDRLLRRLKIDVLKDLPEKRRIIVPVEINQAAYQAALKETRARLAQGGGATNALSALTELRSSIMAGKLDDVAEWITNWCEASSTGKLIVFTQHHKTGDMLHEKIGREISRIIDGRISTMERQAVLDTFASNSKLRVLLGTQQTIGTGLNLTFADTVAFVELPWTPGACDQAEDRIHRIGQTSQKVECYYLLANETIDMDMAELIDAKRKVIAAVVDGKTEVEETSMIGELAKRIMERAESK